MDGGTITKYLFDCIGIRPVVTLKSGVYVDTSEHSGTGTDKYVLHMD